MKVLLQVYCGLVLLLFGASVNATEVRSAIGVLKIQSVVGSFAQRATLLKQQPWWGNPKAAAELTEALKKNPLPNAGPLGTQFPYQDCNDGLVGACKDRSNNLIVLPGATGPSYLPRNIDLAAGQPLFATTRSKKPSAWIDDPGNSIPFEQFMQEMQVSALGHDNYCDGLIAERNFANGIMYSAERNVIEKYYATMQDPRSRRIRNEIISSGVNCIYAHARPPRDEQLAVALKDFRHLADAGDFEVAKSLAAKHRKIYEHLEFNWSFPIFREWLVSNDREKSLAGLHFLYAMHFTPGRFDHARFKFRVKSDQALLKKLHEIAGPSNLEQSGAAAIALLLLYDRTDKDKVALLEEKIRSQDQKHTYPDYRQLYGFLLASRANDVEIEQQLNSKKEHRYEGALLAMRLMAHPPISALPFLTKHVASRRHLDHHSNELKTLNHFGHLAYPYIEEHYAGKADSSLKAYTPEIIEATRKYRWDRLKNNKPIPEAFSLLRPMKGQVLTKPTWNHLPPETAAPTMSREIAATLRDARKAAKAKQACALNLTGTDYETIAVGIQKGQPSKSLGGRDGRELTQADIHLNRPGKKTVLVLMASEPVVWRIKQVNKSQLVGVVVSGTHRQSLLGVSEKIPVVHFGQGQARSNCGDAIMALKRGMEYELLAQKLGFALDIRLDGIVSSTNSGVHFVDDGALTEYRKKLDESIIDVDLDARICNEVRQGLTAYHHLATAASEFHATHGSLPRGLDDFRPRNRKSLSRFAAGYGPIAHANVVDGEKITVAFNTQAHPQIANREFSHLIETKNSRLLKRADPHNGDNLNYLLVRCAGKR